MSLSRIKLIAFGIAALMIMLVACAGTQSAPSEEPSGVKEETLPPAAAVQPPTKQPVVSPVQQSPEPDTGLRSDRIKFMYEDIYFKRGSTGLDAAAKSLLDQKARWLQDNPGVKVVIEGHTDYRGSKEYNLALGDRRSGTVKSYLMRRGVARERLVAISYGKEKPAVTGRTEKDRAKNRRVHFAIED